MLLSAQNLSKSYVETKLFDHVSLYLKRGDRIGLVGVNGTGKSTLLKILAGVESPDEGTVTASGKTRVAYLPQAPDFQPGTTVLEQVFLGMNAQDREQRQYEAKSILTKLGLTEFERDVSLLSGGQKKRVAIAGALVHPSDVLILDEPTNHIDSDMVSWLEEYLSKYTGALLMVTHDRYFLDRVVNTIAELDHASLYLYENANYSAFLEKKAQREEMLAASERKRQSLMKKELAWLSRGARARGTKSRFRIERYEELSGQSALKQAEQLTLSSVSSRLGKKTLELKEVCKSYEGKPLIRGLNYLVRRDDRLGILGPNGCGKSTLLSLIRGSVQPDSGEIIVGETVQFGYFSQENTEMDPNQKVIDYIREAGEYVQTPDGSLSASQMLEKFLFDGTLQWNTIGRLSGGERRRLALLRVLMQAPNILLLDEPTNDLDIETLTILEDYLQGFDGAVIAVSHDRYFLDKIADHLLVFEGNGEITQSLGGYTDYREQAAAKRDGQEKKQQPVKEKRGKDSNLPKKLKFTYQEQRDYNSIDGEIAQLEQEIAQAEEKIRRCADDYVKLQELLSFKEKLERELEEKMERWVYLNDLAQKIEEQNIHP